MKANRLVLNIQPDEGICISFGAKKPGTEMNIGNVAMDFSYIKAFGNGSRSAYAHALERLFAGRRDVVRPGGFVEAAWALVDPILDVRSAAKTATVPSTLLVAGDRRNRTNYSKETADNGITLKTV